jgi:hypothetical protein
VIKQTYYDPKVEMKLDTISRIRNIISQLIDNGWYEEYIIALMSIETNEMVTTNNLKKYESTYKEYMEKDHITLLSEELTDIIESKE